MNFATDIVYAPVCRVVPRERNKHIFVTPSTGEIYAILGIFSMTNEAVNYMRMTGWSLLDYFCDLLGSPEAQQYDYAGDFLHTVYDLGLDPVWTARQPKIPSVLEWLSHMGKIQNVSYAGVRSFLSDRARAHFDSAFHAPPVCPTKTTHEFVYESIS